MLKTIYITNKFTPELYGRFKEQFRIVRGKTVNGEVIVDATDGDMERLARAERLGYIQIRNKPIKL